MLIQKLNAFNTQRYQSKGVNKDSMRQGYASNLRGALKQDVVSFGINLEPKLLSSEVNLLLGKVIKTFEAEQKAILEALNAPIIEISKKVGVKNVGYAQIDTRYGVKYDLPLYDKKVVENLSLTKKLDDGSVLSFSKLVSRATGKDAIEIRFTRDDYRNLIKIQENCLEQIVSNKKGVELNNAFFNQQTTPKQMQMLRMGSAKCAEEVTNPETSNGIIRMNKDLKTFLGLLSAE